jgi:hypothetical protein
MNVFLLDIGSTFIKYSVFDTTTQECVFSDKLAFPEPSVNDGVRFCDNNGILIYAFDTGKMLSASFTFYLSQNYILEVSTDGKNYTIVADYSEGGKVPHLEGGGNEKAITVNPFSYGAGESGVFYVRIRNTDTSKGFGGCISKFTMDYTKEEN